MLFSSEETATVTFSNIFKVISVESLIMIKFK